MLAATRPLSILEASLSPLAVSASVQMFLELNLDPPGVWSLLLSLFLSRSQLFVSVSLFCGFCVSMCLCSLPCSQVFTVARRPFGSVLSYLVTLAGCPLGAYSCVFQRITLSSPLHWLQTTFAVFQCFSVSDLSNSMVSVQFTDYHLSSFKVRPRTCVNVPARLKKKERKKRLDSTWICENLDEFTTNMQMNINPHEREKILPSLFCLTQNTHA